LTSRAVARSWARAQGNDDRDRPDRRAAAARVGGGRACRAPAERAAGRDQELARLSDELERQLIDAEREHLYELLCDGRLKDDARRRIESELDLRDALLTRTTPGRGNDDV